MNDEIKLIDMKYLPKEYKCGSFFSNKEILYFFVNYTGRGYLSYHSNTQILRYDRKTEKWVEEIELPEEISRFAYIVINNKLYVIGGFHRVYDTVSNTVYCSVIAEDGQLSEWQKVGNIPYKLCITAACCVVKDKLFLLGGYSGDYIDNGTYIGNIICTNVNDDGSLGEWETIYNGLPENIAKSKYILTNNKIYLIGGIGIVYPKIHNYNLLHLYPEPRLEYKEHVYIIDSDELYSKGKVENWKKYKLPYGDSIVGTFKRENKIYIFVTRGNKVIIYYNILSENGDIQDWIQYKEYDKLFQKPENIVAIDTNGIYVLK